jgi:hypothetical protein
MLQDTISALIGYLDTLALNSDNELFKRHCNSIIDVIESRPVLTKNDTMFLKLAYRTFSDTTVPWIANDLSSYLARKRPFILSWISPTDGAISLGWLVPPENWNPDESYLLYVRLHGLWNVCDDAIDYMTYNFRPNFFMQTSFEDGYSFSPWGRGNYWYEGISETDIWEGIDVLEKVVRVNPRRKYLTGHSMGGYGVWNIGQKTPDTWAALGVYAGALWYGNGALLNDSIAQRLRSV